MAKRFFVQLAHVYKDQYVSGWLMSEKLDGMRAYWDGGISRGVPCSEVPYANREKDHIRVDEQIATGLWSRGGKKIPAPDWWLDDLPSFPLDGELYLGAGMFQEVMSTCKREGADWTGVQYCVYGRPDIMVQFADGEICFNANQKINANYLPWIIDRIDRLGLDAEEFRGCKLRKLSAPENDVVFVLPQIKLPLQSVKFKQMIEDMVTKVTEEGGEGLMLANPDASWRPHRTHDLLKVKTFQEGEGEVVGYVWGRQTDKGSKLQNLMGQLQVRFEGHVFGLSGFTDREREMWHTGGERTTLEDWRPSQPIQSGIWNPIFPVGSTVRFKYRELTDDGVPKEARYWR